MNQLNLDEGRIRLSGKWYSAEDLTSAIQNKIQAGDMKFADLAAALERLNVALENSHRLEVNLVISKEEYAELKEIGGMDDRECIRKAIMAFIGYDVGMDKMRKKKAMVAETTENQPAVSRTEVKRVTKMSPENAPVKCFKCKSPMELRPGSDSNELQCPNCSSEGREKSASLSDSQVRYKDHFLG